MAVNLSPPDRLFPVQGVRLATIAAGVRYANRDDLLLVELAAGSVTSAVFTTNLFCAAPVTIARRHLTSNNPRYLLINSGNANAGTGMRGEQDAMRCCELLATQAGCETGQVLPFSTGVIGERLPVEKISRSLPGLVENLNDNAWLAAASAIMTTDTVAKAQSRKLVFNGVEVTLTGIAKGSGMICPDMATMLAFITTDLELSADQAAALLSRNVVQTFNAITVDGDTSTNDACVLSATGKVGVSYDQLTAEDRQRFDTSLLDLMKVLAQAIVRDGEGATKFITIQVRHAVNEDSARRVAYTLAHSPLVKTAFFASDPNWGRILAAVGRSNADGLAIEHVSIYLNEVCVIEQGSPHSGYTEQAGQAVMSQDEITILIDLDTGNASAELWTCDLSHEYVRINAEYRS